MSYSDPCHDTCLLAEVIRRFAADEQRETMVREHFRFRQECFAVYLPRQEQHRRAWRQQYGTDPMLMGDRRYPEDDYACRYSGFTSDGAEQIRIREGMIRTGAVPLPCMVDGTVAPVHPQRTPQHHRRIHTHAFAKEGDACYACIHERTLKQIETGTSV